MVGTTQMPYTIVSERVRKCISIIEAVDQSREKRAESADRSAPATHCRGCVQPNILRLSLRMTGNAIFSPDSSKKTV